MKTPIPAATPFASARPHALRRRIGIGSETFRSIMRISAIYDLVVTAPFMTPWTLAITLGLIQHLHTSLGLPGGLPAFESTHLLFAGLMGSVVVVWSLARLQLNSPVLGRYDAIARLLFALWQVFAVANGATPLILVFTAFELIFGVLQALPVKVSTAEQKQAGVAA